MSRYIHFRRRLSRINSWCKKSRTLPRHLTRLSRWHFPRGKREEDTSLLSSERVHLPVRGRRDAKEIPAYFRRGISNGKTSVTPDHAYLSTQKVAAAGEGKNVFRVPILDPNP